VKITEFKILFVGGIHGVGKSGLSNVATKELGIPRLSASELITQQTKAPAALNKRVQDVEKNQDALIAAIESISIKNPKFLLDGHFCVFDSSDTVRRIPLETFKTLGPIAVIVFFDDIDLIQERIRVRDGKVIRAELLDSLQQAEVNHAKEVCSVLKIPICLVRPTEHKSAMDFAKRHLNK